MTRIALFEWRQPPRSNKNGRDSARTGSLPHFLNIADLLVFDAILSNPIAGNPGGFAGRLLEYLKKRHIF